MLPVRLGWKGLRMNKRFTIMHANGTAKPNFWVTISYQALIRSCVLDLTLDLLKFDVVTSVESGPLLARRTGGLVGIYRITHEANFVTLMPAPF